MSLSQNSLVPTPEEHRAALELEPQLDEMRHWLNELARRDFLGCECEISVEPGYVRPHRDGACECWCVTCDAWRATRRYLDKIERSALPGGCICPVSKKDEAPWEEHGPAGCPCRCRTCQAWQEMWTSSFLLHAREEQVVAEREARRQEYQAQQEAWEASTKARQARLAEENRPALDRFTEEILGRRDERLAITSGSHAELAVRSPAELAPRVPGQLIPGGEQGIIARGVELELALHGSTAEIDEYLDLVALVRGRSAEMHSADVITCERRTRELNRLTDEHRVINASDPDGPGTSAERIAALRTLIADISQACANYLLEDGTIYSWGRSLWEFDPSADPPCGELDSPARLRDALDRLIPSLYDGDWGIYARHADLAYTDHIPGTGPKPRSGFWPDTDGTWYHAGHKATQAELRQLGELIASTPLPGNVTVIPDFSPVAGLDVFTDKELAFICQAGKYPGTLTRDEVQQAYATQDGGGWFWAARPEEPVRRALAGGRPVLPPEQSLAERIAALVPWRGPLSELAQAVGWPRKPQSLSVEIKKLRSELLALGVIAGKTGDRCGGRLRLEEWSVEKILTEIEG